jgi:hypothetical protein
MKYITVGTYFSYEEAESVKGNFVNREIDFMITDHGPNFELNAKYFQIKVKAAHLDEATSIIQLEKEAFEKKKNKCPQCGHSEYERVNKNIIERFVFAGTNLVQCSKCGEKFGI